MTVLKSLQNKPLRRKSVIAVIEPEPIEDLAEPTLKKPPKKKEAKKKKDK